MERKKKLKHYNNMLDQKKNPFSSNVPPEPLLTA
jgi:hypothetical protein